MPTYSLMYNTLSGAIFGAHYYGENNALVAKNEIVCTETQYNQANLYVVDVSTTPPTLVQSLAVAQNMQIEMLTLAYATSIQAPVSYTSKGGITKTYQADPQSVANLTQMLLTFQAAAATPAGFYWVSVDNTRVPFTYVDMQGLASAFGAQGVPAFQQLQNLKAEVLAATTVSAVQAIVW